MAKSDTRRFTVAICMVLLTWGALASRRTSAAEEASSATVATIAVKGSLPESPGGPGLFGETQQNLSDLLKRLEQAGDDEKIDAIVLKLRNPALGRGKVNEVRQAIARVRKKDKRIIAEMQVGATADYLIATACDEIVMPESGYLVLPGVRFELMYMKGLFEKIGLEPDFMQMGKYKGASEPYTRKGASEEFRGQLNLVVDDFYASMVEDIATSRKMDKEQVERAIDRGLFTAVDAMKAGLIDRVMYEDQYEGQLARQLHVDEIEYEKNYAAKKVDTDFSGITGFLRLMELMMGLEPNTIATRNKKIAVVYAVGPIMSGSSQQSLLSGEIMGSDTIVKALRAAAENKTVEAIVLRVDSPGGSAVASDMIWREIQQIEKPVYASMGDTAASGGYYISMGCDKIFAEPGTLTGSIGVVSGKFAMKEMFGKIGVTTEVIARGKNSGLFSAEEKFTDAEREVMTGFMQEIYDQFTAKAADGRKMNVKKLREDLAQGRLWSGRQAKANGLVDEVGTLRDAIAAAKKEVGIGADEKVELLILPKPKSLFELLLDPTASDAALGAKAKTTLDAVIPQAGQHTADVILWQKLLEEKAVLMLPYRVEVK